MLRFNVDLLFSSHMKVSHSLGIELKSKNIPSHYSICALIITIYRRDRSSYGIGSLSTGDRLHPKSG